MTTFARMKGLTTQQAIDSRKLHGSNILTPPKKDPLWKQFLETLTGPLGHFIPGWSNGDSLVFILEMAFLLSLFISCSEYFGWIGVENEVGLKVFFEPAGIILAILLATGISFYFEVKASREFDLLNQVNDEEPVKVYRDGKIVSIRKCDVVVGDVVVLTTGDEIPADGELLEAVSLNVDESTLTGEPLCHKTIVKEEFDADATFPSNQVMRGTKVMEGHCEFRVLAVGDNTENGKVFEASQISDGEKTPLDEQFDRLGLVITALSVVVGLLIIVGRLLVFFNRSEADFSDPHFLAYFLQTIMIAATLVVCSVPEGLPMAIKLSLALSMRRMLKTNNLVRKLHACETMGATTVICTDKTGTLTQNKMQVSEVMLDESQLSLAYLNMAVNSTAVFGVDAEGKECVLGNPTEGALLLYLREKGIDYAQLRSEVKISDEVSFNTERKYMSCRVEAQNISLPTSDNQKNASISLPHREGRGGSLSGSLLIKGAPEIVMGMCKTFAVNESAVKERLLEYQNKGMRTLGFAADDCFLGVVAISDPIRNDVPDAIPECVDAGIAVKVVTGDTPVTAREIARQIGLWTDTDDDECIITGPEFAALSDEELLKRIEKLKIIARARPMDKKRLVEMLKRNGHVVAVTGDGTNDAPALKTAHVGLSMGDGTSVAKEASDITIIDNSFASIGRAVMWGRSLYQNIQRFILFQLTVNVAACIVVLVGAFMGEESPLTVTQMLWINLIMDTFAAMALASLPPSAAVMKHKPRDRKAFIIGRTMWISILFYGGLFAGSLTAMLWFFQQYDIESLTSWILGTSQIISNTDGNPKPVELSIVFTIFVMFQFWNLFNARALYTSRSAFHLKGCKGFLGIVAAIFFGQVAIMNLAPDFFNVVPIGIADWLIIIAATSVVLWIGELSRLLSK